MTTSAVSFAAIDQHVEIIVRGGDVAAADSLRTLRNAYQRDPDYPDVVGISVLFRVGADVDELSRTNPLPNARLSHATVARIAAELASASCGLLLYITPQPVLGLPDHHTLAFVRHDTGMRVEPPPPDEPIAALIRALAVSDNHYRKKRP